MSGYDQVSQNIIGMLIGGIIALLIIIAIIVGIVLLVKHLIKFTARTMYEEKAKAEERHRQNTYDQEDR